MQHAHKIWAWLNGKKVPAGTCKISKTKSGKTCVSHVTKWLLGSHLVNMREKESLLGAISAGLHACYEHLLACLPIAVTYEELSVRQPLQDFAPLHEWVITLTPPEMFIAGLGHHLHVGLSWWKWLACFCRSSHISFMYMHFAYQNVRDYAGR